ncbi:hypothetical protein GCM10027436_54780 [Actinophytocola sediminis]
MADPLVAGHYGKAAFDAVGPLLLIGWAEVGPVLLQALATVSATGHPGVVAQTVDSGNAAVEPREGMHVGAELLERARHEDRSHRKLYQRPISAENLREGLGIGAERPRTLVRLVRAERGISASRSSYLESSRLRRSPGWVPRRGRRGFRCWRGQ